MEIKVGYISKWRQKVFFTIVGMAVILGLLITLNNQYLNIPVVSSFINVIFVLVALVLIILVIADRNNSYLGTAIVEFKDNSFTLKDKYRNIEILYSDIKKLDMDGIYIQKSSLKVYAFEIIITTSKMKYHIESEKADGREYNEVDIYNLYLELMKIKNK